VPVPEEEGNGESGMCVRPRGIEIHVDGKRAGPPDGDGRQERPAFVDVLASETKGKEQSEKAVEGRGERHSEAIRSGETVGGDGGTEYASELDARVGDEKKRRPENGGADSEMVVEMAGGSAEFLPRLAVFVEARAAEAFVGVAIIFGEVEVVLDERSARKSIIADAVAADPGIEKREREKKEKKKQALGFVSARSARGAGVLLIHERSARRKLLLSPAAMIACKITM
jgi:hypothetical protein